MEIKTFNKITKEIFAAYGFKKNGKNYILELADITIFVWLDYYCGLRSIHYSLSIHALHNQNEEIEKRHDFVFSKPLTHNTNPKGSQQHKLCIVEWTETQYREILRKLLCEYFDPYKEKGLQHLKDIGHTLHFTKRATRFLFSKFDVTEQIKKRMLEYYFEWRSYSRLKGIVVSKYNDAVLEIDVEPYPRLAGDTTYSLNESLRQKFAFFANKELWEMVSIGNKITFGSSPMVFYDCPYPIVMLEKDGVKFLEFEKGRKDYLEWIEKTFPINKD